MEEEFDLIACKFSSLYMVDKLMFDTITDIHMYMHKINEYIIENEKTIVKLSKSIEDKNSNYKILHIDHNDNINDLYKEIRFLHISIITISIIFCFLYFLI